MNNHLEAVLKEKRSLRQRLLKPMCQGNLPVEAVYHRLDYKVDINSYMFPAAAAAAKSLQSCPTLCDPIDGSPPGSTVPRILQARTLEWVAISFSNA